MVSKSAFSPRLVIIEGKDKGKVIPLQNGTAVIGRSKGDVLVQDPRVSRSHIALHFDERSGLLTFTDLKSLNGSLVNSERTDAGELHDGDRLQLGNTVFDCQISADEVSDAGKFSLRSPFKRKENSPDSPLEEVLLPVERSQPDFEAVAREDSERTSHGFMPKVQKVYLHFPRRARIIALCVVMVALALKFSVPSSKTKETADVDLDSIRLLATQGKVDEAIAKAVAIREKNPTSVNTDITLAELYESQQKYELAISAYQKAIELDAADVHLKTKVVELYLQAGLVREAQGSFEKLEQIIKDGPRTQKLFKEVARLLLDHKELNEPSEKSYIVAKALETEFAPDDPVGYKLEAQALLQESRSDEAMTALLKARKLDPNDEWVIENMAFARLTAKDMAGALEILQQWVKEKPVSTKPLLVLAYLRYNEKDYQGALQFTQRLLQVTSNNPKDAHLPEALNLMGQIYVQENQVTEAEASLRRSCDLGFRTACENDLLKNSGSASAVAPKSGASALTPPPSQPANAASTTSATAPAAEKVPASEAGASPAEPVDATPPGAP
jgi:tetratricopeptide (TPR) repeat protein